MQDSGTPELETADFSQSHVSLNYSLIVYFVYTQAQKLKIFESIFAIVTTLANKKY